MRVNKGPLTFLATTALAPYLRVKLTAGKLVAAGATDDHIGTLEERVLAADDPATVVPRWVEGTVKMVAAGAIAQNADVYGAAGGKVNDVVNENFIGITLTAATGDGSYMEVLPMTKADKVDNLGAIDGNLVLDDDFVDDYPAAQTALPLGSQPWLKVETLGLGVIESDEANGVLKHVFDAVAEVAVAVLYTPAFPFDIDKKPIVEFLAAVFDIGDAAALDINFGLVSDYNADFDSSSQYIAFHLDGADLSVCCQSFDGTNTTAATDTLVDLVDDEYTRLKIDLTDLEDCKFFINGVRVLAATTFDMSDYAGRLGVMVHVEKESDDTLADVRVDRIRVQCERN